MRFKVTKKNLQLTDATEEEIEFLRLSLKKRIDKWFFHPLVKKGMWDGYISFFHKDKFVSFGLWYYLYKVCKDNNYELKIDGLERLFNSEVGELSDTENWLNWLVENNSEINLRNYQPEAIHNILKYRYCSEKIAVGGGKTFIMFAVASWLLKNIPDVNWKFLVIAPSSKLITQGIENFKEYYNGCKRDIPIKWGGLNKDIKPSNDDNFIFGTYQSIIKQDEEWIKSFNFIFIDEFHTIKGKTIQDILKKNPYTYYRVGLTGTYPESEFQIINGQSFTGPKVKSVSVKDMQDSGYAPNCKVYILKLNYVSKEVRKSFAIASKDSEKRDKLYDYEKKLITTEKRRISFINNLINKIKSNTLVLFYLTDYGKEIYNHLQDNNHDKRIFYIDGEVGNDLRDYYQNEMEKNDNVILVASFGVLSVGVSIRNIHNIIFAEAFKSHYVIEQSIGRGIREHPNKDLLKVFDLVDDFSYSENKKIGIDKLSWKNYSLKHMDERIKIYDKEKYPYDIKTISI